MHCYGNLETRETAPQAGPTKPGVPRPDPGAGENAAFGTTGKTSFADAAFSLVAGPSPLLPDAPRVVDEILLQVTRGYKAGARSGSTQNAYGSDWRHFAAWCAAGGYEPLPAEPQTVEFYLADHAPSGRPGSLSLSTLSRRLVGIAHAHREAGYESATAARSVRDTLQGIRRAAADGGRAGVRQATPILIEDLREILGALAVRVAAAGTSPARLLPLRDRAMLLFEFSCALRAGEVGMLNVSDLREVGRKGYIVTLRRSKTDQMAKGAQIAVAHGANPGTCPVIALREWLGAAGITSGPLFPRVDRHGNVGKIGITRKGITIAVKRAARYAGLDPSGYSGHSLRAGLATSAALMNAPYAKIKEQGRWKSDRVLGRYIRDAELFRDNAATSTGL